MLSVKEKELLAITYRIYQDGLNEGRRLMKEGAGGSTDRHLSRPNRAGWNRMWKRGDRLYKNAEKGLVKNIGNILAANGEKIVQDPHGRIYLGDRIIEKTLSSYEIDGINISKL
jgi:hypothetical protein